MIGSRGSLLALLLASILLTAGCLGSVGDGDQPEAAEIKDDSLEALESVESYAFELDLEQRVGGVDASMHIDGQTEADGDRSSMTLSAPALGVEESEVVVIENRTYQRVPETDDWVVFDADEFGPDQQELDRQAELLEGAEATYDGTDEVDGQEVHVLSLDVDEDAYASILESGIADGEVDMAIDEIGVVQYVDVESDRIRQVEIDYAANMTGVGGATQQVEATVTVTYDSFGETFEIEAPEDATPAEEYEEPPETA